MATRKALEGMPNMRLDGVTDALTATPRRGTLACRVFSAAALVVVATAAFGREVKVSSFGYDPEDSTRFLQAALDSGADRVIVDRQKDPWISKPLFGRSNTEIVFEDGAEILAKKGEFLGKYDSLLSFIGMSNVVVRGDGNVVVRNDSPDKESFYFDRSFQLRLSGISFVGGRNQIRVFEGNHAGPIHIDGCRFSGASGTAVFL